MERVETLTNSLNTLQNFEPIQESQQLHVNVNTSTETAQSIDSSPQHAESQNLEMMITEFDNIGDMQNIDSKKTKSSEISLDDVLNSISPTQKSYSLQPKMSISVEQYVEQQLVNTPDKQFTFINSFNNQQINSDTENKNKIQNLDLDDVLAAVHVPVKEDDLISTILGADDSASNYGGDVAHSTNIDIKKLVADKLKLSGMNVKQLKQIAKDLNIKSRGTKTELVESIFEKLNQTISQSVVENTHETAEIAEVLCPQPVIQESQPSPCLVVEDFPDDI
jgi:hypothetical protein